MNKKEKKANTEGIELRNIDNNSQSNEEWKKSTRE